LQEGVFDASAGYPARHGLSVAGDRERAEILGLDPCGCPSEGAIGEIAAKRLPGAASIEVAEDPLNGERQAATSLDWASWNLGEE
jgi:hypothetical protein